MFERTITELLYGKSAHANPLACVEDLSAKFAARTADGFPHSIWQLVGHMNYWMHFELHRIAGQPRSYPEHSSGSWIADPAPPTQAHWTQGVATFRDLLANFAALAQSDLQSLSREIPPAHPQQAQNSSAVGAILWQIVAHNSYHVGQIAMLRCILGAWPPAAGGDSW